MAIILCLSNQKPSSKLFTHFCTEPLLVTILSKELLKRNIASSLHISSLKQSIDVDDRELDEFWRVLA